VCVGCGLIWIGLQYGQEYEESRAYLRLLAESGPMVARSGARRS
jgi:hypothetical protein